VPDSEFSAEAISQIEDSDVFFSIKDENEEDEEKRSVH
jgi:hypothetical protein